MENNSGSNRANNVKIGRARSVPDADFKLRARLLQSRTSAKRDADLKLRARLLPELYGT